jgi:hypothetical protein
MIHDFYGKKSKLFKHILSPLISYQICTKLLNKNNNNMEIIVYMGKKWRERVDQWTRSHTFDQSKINIVHLIEG